MRCFDKAAGWAWGRAFVCCTLGWIVKPQAGVCTEGCKEGCLTNYEGEGGGCERVDEIKPRLIRRGDQAWL
jgi:hypothetical protein